MELPRYSKTVVLKLVENGWIVNYDETRFDKGQQRDVTQRHEKAFVFSNGSDIIKVWNNLNKFVSSRLIAITSWKEMYPEEKEQK